jgi:hypothetical protein
MKHPTFEVLQDYFENALNQAQEMRVKEHLLACEKCTALLAQFVQLENKIKMQRPLQVSKTKESEIFLDAKKMLAQRREKAQKQLKQKKEMKVFFEDWKEHVFPEFKVPALQLCSISLVLATFVALEQAQNKEEEYFEPLSKSVNVFTFKDISNSSEE